jgi:RNA polymerase sigma-70 factor (ECF subfamily)
MSPSSESPEHAPRRGFATTRWSLVLAAGTPGSADALAALSTTYWYPIYAFIRRSGCSAHDAEDLTQQFFARLLEKNFLAGADRAKGRFRSYLLGALKHFLANQRDRAAALKRGGGQMMAPLEGRSAEERYRHEPADELTPEKLFERRWALTVLEQALTRLRDEHAAAGKLDLFDRLKPALTGELPGGFAELAAELGMTEGAVKAAVHRLRKRYREAMRAEIAQTVAREEEVEDEIRALFAALG